MLIDCYGFVDKYFWIFDLSSSVQRRLGDAAKKAIGKLTTRTVKKGDKVGPTSFILACLLPSHPISCLGYEFNMSLKKKREALRSDAEDITGVS